jgi:predicted DNA-binding ribbon-helix-helix protein
MTTNLSNSTVDLATLYEQDYYLWLETTVQLLQQGKLTQLDLDNLIDEIAYMARKEKKALASNLKILLMHLLKYKYQPEKRSNSWRYTILEHRQRIEADLEDSPSLKPYLQDVFPQIYSKARKVAAAETGLDISTFPPKSPFTLEVTLDPDYLPE